MWCTCVFLILAIVKYSVKVFLQTHVHVRVQIVSKKNEMLHYVTVMVNKCHPCLHHVPMCVVPSHCGSVCLESVLFT